MTKHLPPFRCLIGSLLLLLLASQGAMGQNTDASKAKTEQKTDPLTQVTKACPNCLPDVSVTCDTALKEVTLDFNCRCLDKDAVKTLNELKPGDTYRVRILHINPLLYKIGVGVKDTSKVTAYSFPTFASIGLSDLNTLATGLTPAAIVSKVPAPLSSSKRAFGDDFAKDRQQQKDALTLINDYRAKVKGYIERLAVLSKQVDDAFLLYNKKLLNSRLEYQFIAQSKKTAPTDIDAASSTLIATRDNLAQLRKEAAVAATQYTQDISQFQKAIDADPTGLKKGDDEVKAAYKQFTEDLTKAEANVATDKVQALLKALTDAVNNSCLQYVSLPLQFTQQQTRLGIHIEPRGTDNTLQAYHTQLVFPIDRRFFWGVSTGLFVSHLYNEAYSAKAQTAGGTTTYTLIAEDPSKVEFGTSAMLRVGRQFGRNDFGWQFGFGPALAVGTKVRPRLLVGTGLSVGSLHRVLLDGGLALGYVDRLSTAYEVPGSYATAPDNTVVSTLKASFYIGLHYLFTK